MRTAFLMTALTVLLVLVGDYFGGARGMMMMLIISLAMNLFSYWNSDKLVLAQYNAKQVDEKSAPALYKMVQRLAERGNLPMPKVYIIDSPVPNAFATGRNPEHAAVAVTTALANALDKDEIEGVLAHELSHVKHGDILIGTIAASMAGIITTLSHWGCSLVVATETGNSSSSAIVGLAMMILAPLAAGIIQMAVSRSREYMADKSGGELSGNPDALADALLKIESYAKNRTMPGATENTAHMFIICPFSAKDMQQLFSTHPSTADRVARLRAQAKAMRSSGGAK